MEKEFSDYIPDIRLVRELERHFDGDLNTRDFDSKSDFETYLCALAYACLGKELFYDSRISLNLEAKQKNNDIFMQGMLTYSLIAKINKAKEIMNSIDFSKTKTISFEKEDQENDYATIAFVMYYLTTKGFRVEWDKMSHAISPINLEKGPVSFAEDKKLDPQVLIDNVKQDLNSKKVV